LFLFFFGVSSPTKEAGIDREAFVYKCNSNLEL
jgi:hypothetical protein